MSNLSIKEMINAGVHFGHQSSRWNHKMFHYIYTEHNGIHVIDLVQTARLLTHASIYVQKAAKENKTFLFVPARNLSNSKSLVFLEVSETSLFNIISLTLLPQGTLDNNKYYFSASKY